MQLDIGYGQDTGMLFKEVLANRGVDWELVGEEGVPWEHVEFAPQVSKVMALKPNFVISTPPGGSSIALLKEALRQGVFEQDWLVAWFQCMGSSTDLAPAITEDVIAGKFHDKLWGTGRWIWNQSEREPSLHFTEAYISTYNRYPMYPAALTYSAIYIYKQAIEATGTLDKQAIIKWLEGREFSDLPLGMDGEAGAPLLIRAEDHAGCYTTPLGRYTYEVTPFQAEMEEKYGVAPIAHLTDFSDIPWNEWYRNPPDFKSP